VFRFHAAACTQRVVPLANTTQTKTVTVSPFVTVHDADKALSLGITYHTSSDGVPPECRRPSSAPSMRS
jgi:hypothetical protein